MTLFYTKDFCLSIYKKTRPYEQTIKIERKNLIKPYKELKVYIFSLYLNLVYR